MKRYGQVIKVRPEFEERYRKLHAEPWEAVNRKIKECHIQNYSIFLRDGYLFAYFEYTGDDFSKDMQQMAEDEDTKRWWDETDPCQIPIDTAEPGEWWINMEEIYYLK